MAHLQHAARIIHTLHALLDPLQPLHDLLLLLLHLLDLHLQVRRRMLRRHQMVIVLVRLLEVAHERLVLPIKICHSRIGQKLRTYFVCLFIYLLLVLIALSILFFSQIFLKIWQVFLATEQFQGRNKNKNSVFKKLTKNIF